MTKNIIPLRNHRQLMPFLEICPTHTFMLYSTDRRLEAAERRGCRDVWG